MNPTMSINSLPSSQTFKPIDFNEVSELPDSLAWTSTLPLDSPDSHPVNPSLEEPFPIIDLAKPDAVNLIRDACEKWGSFRVTNHGIPINLLHEIDCQTRRLFSLPTKRKELVARKPGGVIGYSLPRMSAFFPKKMWSEGFSIVGSPVEHATQLWPDKDNANFCEVMEQYQAKMKTLCKQMVKIILNSLDLTNEEDVKWFEPKNECDQTTCVLQLNSFPVCPDPSRAMGLAPHTDSSLITLLYTDSTVNGLQVYRDGVGWVAVEPVEGTLVVNLGDLMQIVSNGKFKSVLHRVVVNNMHHRVSVGYFYGPPKDAKVSPLSKLIDYSDHPPIYRPVTWVEYLDIKTKHFRKSLEIIRL